METHATVVQEITKKPYQTPEFVIYGLVSELTQAGSNGPLEVVPLCIVGFSTRRCISSRHMKENINLIGSHPMGFGIYLFDYKPEFKDYAGHGRQFGVMIDEVVGVLPAAVGVDERGYPVVDYAMLGVHMSVCH